MSSQKVSTPMGSAGGGGSLSSMFQLMILVVWVATLCVIAGRKIERYASFPPPTIVHQYSDIQDTDLDRRKAILIKELAKLAGENSAVVGRQVELLKTISDLGDIGQKSFDTLMKEAEKQSGNKAKSVEDANPDYEKRYRAIQKHLPPKPDFKSQKVFSRLVKCSFQVSLLLESIGKFPERDDELNAIRDDLVSLLKQLKTELVAPDNMESLLRIEKQTAQSKTMFAKWSDKNDD